MVHGIEVTSSLYNVAAFCVYETMVEAGEANLNLIPYGIGAD